LVPNGGVFQPPSIVYRQGQQSPHHWSQLDSQFSFQLSLHQPWGEPSPSWPAFSVSHSDSSWWSGCSLSADPLSGPQRDADCSQVTEDSATEPSDIRRQYSEPSVEETSYVVHPTSVEPDGCGECGTTAAALSNNCWQSFPLASHEKLWNVVTHHMGGSLDAMGDRQVSQGHSSPYCSLSGIQVSAW
jgi:hypothetical protein